MNGQQIANEMGISRQAVSKILQCAVRNVYEKLEGTPKERLLNMYIGMDIKDENDMKALYKLLPNHAKDNIKIDLIKTFHVKGAEECLKT